MAYSTRHGAQLLERKPRCSCRNRRPVASCVSWPLASPGSRSKPVSSSKSQEALTQDSVDDVIDALKDAFGAALMQPDTTSIVESQAGNSSSQTAAAVGDGNGNDAGRAKGLAKPSRNSHVDSQNGSTSRKLPYVSHTDSKKRRGPFVDLISAIEQDMKHPSTQSNRVSGSSNSNNSKGGNSQHIKSVNSSLPAALGTVNSRSQTGNNNSSEGDSSNSSSSTRSSTRRITRHADSQQKSGQQQQQQQRGLLQQPQQLQLEPDWLHHPLVSAGSKKQYKLVLKGDLALPGGPAWSSLRRHVAAAGSNPDLPTLQSIVLVEGDQDLRAVARAVNAPAYVCDGTRVLKGHVQPELEMLKLLGRPLVVLTDPDERGRELRLHLDNLIGPVSHAFVPEQQSMSTADGPVHSAGNRGIEHVVPTGVQQALARARDSYPKDRAVWSLQRLVDLGLANAFDAGEAAAGRGAAARRRQLCAVLGLGKCTGAQLAVVLNRFFDEEAVEAAIAELNAS